MKKIITVICFCFVALLTSCDSKNSNSISVSNKTMSAREVYESVNEENGFTLRDDIRESTNVDNRKIDFDNIQAGDTLKIGDLYIYIENIYWYDNRYFQSDTEGELFIEYTLLNSSDHNIEYYDDIPWRCYQYGKEVIPTSEVYSSERNPHFFGFLAPHKKARSHTLYVVEKNFDVLEFETKVNDGDEPTVYKLRSENVMDARSKKNLDRMIQKETTVTNIVTNNSSFSDDKVGVSFDNIYYIDDNAKATRYTDQRYYFQVFITTVKNIGVEDKIFTEDMFELYVDGYYAEKERLYFNDAKEFNLINWGEETTGSIVIEVPFGYKGIEIRVNYDRFSNPDDNLILYRYNGRQQ